MEKAVDFTRLEKNIIEVIQEEQIKLGYRSELIRLYYPLTSLNRFLHTDAAEKEMTELLKTFSRETTETLGGVEISNKGERFCISIPPAGVDYVHEHTNGSEFISSFIETIGRHGCTIDELLQQFHRYSDHVHVERTTHGEFDYLVYFEDGVPDDYRYCITDEGCHLIYHRFTPEDYEDFQF